jgi:hypothetical protein
VANGSGSPRSERRCQEPPQWRSSWGEAAHASAAPQAGSYAYTVKDVYARGHLRHVTAERTGSSANGFWIEDVELAPGSDSIVEGVLDTPDSSNGRFTYDVPSGWSMISLPVALPGGPKHALPDVDDPGPAQTGRFYAGLTARLPKSLPVRTACSRSPQASSKIRLASR